MPMEASWKALPPFPRLLIKYRTYTVMDDNWRLVNGSELYDINADLGQTENVIDQHPEAAARLAEGYEKWWQSIMAEGPNERYAYLKAGSPKENPIRISAYWQARRCVASAWSNQGCTKFHYTSQVSKRKRIGDQCNISGTGKNGRR